MFFCIPRFLLQQAFAFGNLSVSHGVAPETAFLGLYADVGHWRLRGAFEIAVAVGGDTDHRAFGHVEYLTIDLELTGSGEDDIILLVFLVAVEERNCLALGKCAE